MNKILSLFSNRLTHRLLVVAILSLFLTSTAFAYKAPKRASRPKVTSSHATRTDGLCLQDVNSKLTILAPVSHIGQSASTEPLFAWFVPASKPRPMELSIYEYAGDKRGKKLKTFELESKPSQLMTFSPSQQGFSFDEGKTYLWQVALLCDRNNPKNDIFAEAVVEFVPKSATLVNQIDQTTDSLQRAQLYSDNGYWYDAFAESFQHPQGKTFRSKILGILGDIEAKTAANLEIEAANSIIIRRYKSYLQAQSLGLEKIAKELN